MKTFDFQVHSKYSFDSLNDFPNIKKKAEKEGIDGIAITDHGTIKGGLLSKKYSDEDFLFISGQEIETECGDLIGLMISEEVESKVFLDAIDEIKEQDGLCYLPHPSRKLKLEEEEILQNIDVIEAINGRSTIKENLYSTKLARSLDLPYASGSDAHTIREIGKVKTVFAKAFEDEENLRKVLLDKNISRKIEGDGRYERWNHLQSSLIGTIRTGKFKSFFKGFVEKLG